MSQPFVAVPSAAAARAGGPLPTGPFRSALLPSGPEAGVETRLPGGGDVAVAPVERTGLNQFGRLAPFLSDGGVTDALINGEQGLWVDRGHGLEREESWNCKERELREIAVRLISLGGRHIDEANPCVDVRLSQGIRVHAVLPPISTTGTLLSIRLPSIRYFTLEDLRENGMFDARMEGFVRTVIVERRNILVTGAAGTGKTTLLGTMLANAPPDERIIAIEDVGELRVDHPHFISLEARQANLEGAGEIGVQRLLREALRMRPDRLVLGECRGGEVRELLAALNTGHDGGAGTLHANSLRDVPARLEALGALAGMSDEAIARQAVSAIGVVMHLESDGTKRCLVEIGELALDKGGRLVVHSVERRGRSRRVDAAAASRVDD